MRDFRDAKTIAATLREALAERGMHLSHSECLELTAQAFGEPDWNTLSALISRDASVPEPAHVSAAGQADAADGRASQWPDVARAFYERHLTPEDRRARTQASPWTRLFEEANALYAGGESPESAEVLDLVRRWTELSFLLSGDNDQLKAKYSAAYQEALDDEDVAPRLPISRDVMEFLRPAFARVRAERRGDRE
jgi:hypothetical protein